MNTFQDKLHPVPPREVQRAIRAKRWTRWINHHLLHIGLITFLIFNLGAWMAPVMMKLGMSDAANIVYTLYSPLCHQMAQRSFFLFGEKVMYTPEEMGLGSTGNSGAEMLVMRRFRGNNELGWKVAWSDRMVYMYGGMWIALLHFAAVSRRRSPHPISIWTLLLLLLPITIDGGTHFISDMGGILAGFRYNNEWLAALTGHIFAGNFYQGDALGSFNAGMRLFSGITFGYGIIWFILPYLVRATQQHNAILDEQLARAEQLYNLKGSS